jgi:hypothetical protein
MQREHPLHNREGNLCGGVDTRGEKNSKLYAFQNMSTGTHTVLFVALGTVAALKGMKGAIHRDTHKAKSRPSKKAHPLKQPSCILHRMTP